MARCKRVATFQDLRRLLPITWGCVKSPHSLLHSSTHRMHSLLPSALNTTAPLSLQQQLALCECMRSPCGIEVVLSPQVVAGVPPQRRPNRLQPCRSHHSMQVRSFLCPSTPIPQAMHSHRSGFGLLSIQRASCTCRTLNLPSFNL